MFTLEISQYIAVFICYFNGILCWVSGMSCNPTKWKGGKAGFGKSTDLLMAKSII